MQERRGRASERARLLGAFLQVLRGSGEAGPTQAASASTAFPSPGCKTLQTHWASNLAGRPRSWAGAGEGVRGSIPLHLEGGGPFVCVECPLARAARSLSPRLVHLLAAVAGCQAAGASAGTARTTDDWSHLHCYHVAAVCCCLGLLPCSPGEETGGTLQPTMKSWQLIAVVGDALQVRRGKRALSAAGEGEAEREAAPAGLAKPTDSREGVAERRGRATGGRSVQIDIFGCLWQRSRRQPLSNVHAGRVAACAPPGLLLRIGTRRWGAGEGGAAMGGCGCACST